MIPDVTAHCSTCNKSVILPHHHGRHEYRTNREVRERICLGDECILNPYEDPVDPRTYNNLTRANNLQQGANEIRDMAMLGKTLLDETTELGKQMIDFGASVLKMAKVIDTCGQCNSYVWINSSNTSPRLSIEKVIMYHFGEHKK